MRRRELFGFEPDPHYPLAPFHPEAVHGMLGVVIAHADGRLSTGVVPLFSEPPGRPVCVSDDRADAVIACLDPSAPPPICRRNGGSAGPSFSGCARERDQESVNRTPEARLYFLSSLMEGTPQGDSMRLSSLEKQGRPALLESV